MKQVLIFALYKNAGHNVHYFKVSIYGIVPGIDGIQYITGIDDYITNIGYGEFIRHCREIYCNYFSVDDNNLLTSDNLIGIS